MVHHDAASHRRGPGGWGGGWIVCIVMLMLGGGDSVHRDADVGGGVIRVDAGCHGFFVQVGKLFTKCVHGFLVEVEAPDAA